MMENNQKYIIGVDGGGTKTVVVLADLNGRILAKSKTSSSHLRNIGVKKAMANLARAIKEVLRKNKNISLTFLGLPATEEEFKDKKDIIKRELLKYKEISPIFKGKLIIGSDQLVGFRTGTDKKYGVLLNAGSGSVAHGWRGEKEAKVGGWGYFSEMGSAFWVGQEGLRKICKDLDDREQKTLITKLALRKLKVKSKENFINKIYSGDSQEIIRSFSILVDKAGKKGDKVARNILTEAGKELALSANTVIKKLNFRKKRFPLVLIGSMFKSKIILDIVKKEIKKVAPKVEFIRPKVEPVMGAVKLATEEIQQEVLKINPKNFKKVIIQAVEALKRGEVIICPTDTIYGLICDAKNKKAVEKIFKIKKRSFQKIISIFVKDFKMAKKFARINKSQEKFLKKVWPGKVIAILRAKGKFPKGIICRQGKIGQRIPKYKLLNEILNKFKESIAQTSANFSGNPTPALLKETLRQFRNKKYQPDLAIDAGRLSGKPSKVIDLTRSTPKILRK